MNRELKDERRLPLFYDKAVVNFQQLLATATVGSRSEIDLKYAKNNITSHKSKINLKNKSIVRY